MNIIKLYKETKDKEQREWFLLNFLLLLTLLGMFFSIYYFEYGTRLYYKANNGLFILDIMIFSMFIGTKAKTKEIVRKTYKYFNNKLTPNLFDYGDILLLIVYLTAIFSFVFILDLSFLSNYGIRAGVVVSVTFVGVIKDLFWSKK